MSLLVQSKNKAARINDHGISFSTFVIPSTDGWGDEKLTIRRTETKNLSEGCFDLL